VGLRGLFYGELYPYLYLYICICIIYIYIYIYTHIHIHINIHMCYCMHSSWPDSTQVQFFAAGIGTCCMCQFFLNVFPYWVTEMFVSPHIDLRMLYLCIMIFWLAGRAPFRSLHMLCTYIERTVLNVYGATYTAEREWHCVLLHVLLLFCCLNCLLI
jgi:hypothetical protein